MSFLREFREFAMRGNVIDLAVGVVIGGAFGKIVASLVGDVVMPALGVLLQAGNLSHLAVTLRPAVDKKPAVILAYGKFLEASLDFVLIALVIFLLLKVINRVTRKPAAPPPPPPPPEPSAEERLLAEIRDLLRQQRG
jgi:large conductance mechanosensitive channel protein